MNVDSYILIIAFLTRHSYIVLCDMILFINCNWVVIRWQYTYTHKQYIEQHK